MKKLAVIIFFGLIFFGLIIPGKTLSAQDSNTFIYALVLDKTGSMMGIGDGNRDTIWFEVQDYLTGFIDMIDYNTKVIVYPFHGTVDPAREFYINSAGAKQELRNYLRGIVPNGWNTAIYRALDEALNDMEENYPDNPKLIYLITDGNDNASSANYSFADNLRRFSAIRGEFDHLYYIDLRQRADSRDIEIADRDSNTHILPGFTRSIEIRSQHNPVPVAIENGKAKFVQDFEIRGFELPEDFRFSCRPDIDQAYNVNLNLLPSVNISKSQLEMIEDGKYRLRFELELLAGNIDESISVPVKLSAPNISSVKTGSVDLSEFTFTGASPGSTYTYEFNYEYVINFNQDRFILNIEMNVPRVSTPAGGWR